MLYRFEDDVVKEQPSHVINTGGANDAFGFVPYGDMIYNYREMIDIAVSNNIIPIVGITPLLMMNLQKKAAEIPFQH